jgi:hypothetical protein
VGDVVHDAQGEVAARGLLLECAVEDIRQDLHVSMAVGAEPGPGPHVVVVDHTERPETHLRGVVVGAEREGVAAVEPAPVGASSVYSGANQNHSRRLLHGVPLGDS